MAAASGAGERLKMPGIATAPVQSGLLCRKGMDNCCLLLLEVIQRTRLLLLMVLFPFRVVLLHLLPLLLPLLLALLLLPLLLLGHHPYQQTSPVTLEHRVLRKVVEGALLWLLGGRDEGRDGGGEEEALVRATEACRAFLLAGLRPFLAEAVLHELADTVQAAAGAALAGDHV